jgi:hypothetical protein
LIDIEKDKNFKVKDEITTIFQIDKNSDLIKNINQIKFEFKFFEES